MMHDEFPTCVVKGGFWCLWRFAPKNYAVARKLAAGFTLRPDEVKPVYRFFAA